MAIQFSCTGCQRPIEVDDELAEQQVTCPYCRQVVMTPAAAHTPITALPASTAAPPPFPSIPQTAATPRPNILATLSLVCGVVLLLGVCGWGFSMTAAAIRDVAPDGNVQGKQKELQEAAMRRMQSTTGAVVYVGLLVVSLVGAVTGILGLLKRVGRRWQSIVGLTICGLYLACQIVTFLAGLGASALSS